MCITYSECVPVGLDIQYAERMRHIILSSLACPAILQDLIKEKIFRRSY